MVTTFDLCFENEKKNHDWNFAIIEKLLKIFDEHDIKSSFW